MLRASVAEAARSQAHPPISMAEEVEEVFHAAPSEADSRSTLPQVASAVEAAAVGEASVVEAA
jgi:hypothetical protein